MAPAQRTNRLFNAIVVLGASLTAGACESDPPGPDAPVVADATPDAPGDAGPDDAPPDVILIL